MCPLHTIEMTRRRVATEGRERVAAPASGPCSAVGPPGLRQPFRLLRRLRRGGGRLGQQTDRQHRGQCRARGAQ